MKIQKLFFLLIFFIFLVFSCNENKTGTWKTIIDINPSQQVTITGFNDDNFGITAGYAGTQRYTNDGGKIWNVGQNNSWCRFGLDILNNNIAWTCGNKGHNRVTDNGGKNWKAQTDYGNMEPRQCRYISYYDENTGWLASPELLARTRDGGKTWEKIDLPQDIDKILAINLSTPETGYLLDANGIIYMTKDSAKTWERIILKIEKNNYVFYPTSASSIVMKFRDNNGIIILRQTNPKKQFVALYTNDEGKTWRNEIILYKAPKNAKSFWDYFLYLSHDWNYLTITTGTGNDNKHIIVLKKS